jgi:hypothetical protein
MLVIENVGGGHKGCLSQHTPPSDEMAIRAKGLTGWLPVLPKNGDPCH